MHIFIFHFFSRYFIFLFLTVVFFSIFSSFFSNFNTCLTLIVLCFEIPCIKFNFLYTNILLYYCLFLSSMYRFVFILHCTLCTDFIGVGIICLFTVSPRKGYRIYAKAVGNMINNGGRIPNLMCMNQNIVLIVIYHWPVQETVRNRWWL